MKWTITLPHQSAETKRVGRSWRTGPAPGGALLRGLPPWLGHLAVLSTVCSAHLIPARLCGAAAFELYVQTQPDKVSFLLPLALRCCACEFPCWFWRKQGLVCVTLCRFLRFEHTSGGGLSGSRWTLGRCGLARDAVLPVSSARAPLGVGAGPSSRLCVIKLVQACRSPITNQVRGLICFLPATEMSLLRGVCVGHFPTLHRSMDLLQFLLSSAHSSL